MQETGTCTAQMEGLAVQVGQSKGQREDSNLSDGQVPALPTTHAASLCRRWM